jgi:hypothetical protein
VPLSILRCGALEIARGAKMDWKRLSSRALPVVAFTAFMTFQSYLAVKTWGLRISLSIISATVAGCLLLLWMALRRN